MSICQNLTVEPDTITKSGASKFQCKKLFKVAPKEGRYKIWEVKCLKDGQKAFLKNLDFKGAISICCENNNIMEFLVEGSRSILVEKLLREREIAFEIIGFENTPGRSSSPRARSGFTSTIKSTWRKERLILDWKDFYPLNIIYQWMDELERLYPATCTVCSIGRTVEGRQIKMLKISNSDAANTGVWLDGCIHAREWISGSVVTYIADHLVRNFSTLPQNITNKDWYLVPIANPDGYQHTHTLDRLWRKSRARFGNSIVGVDLNRNFGFGWGHNGSEGSSVGDPNHQNYRGTEPFSEPESSAIKDLILYSGTPFKIFVTFHSCSELISFPWCYTSDPCPDYVNLLEGGATIAKAMFETTGRMYKVGNFKDIMYYAPGTSIDWSYGIARIPFSYLIELRSREHRFVLPKDEIIECCREALAGIFSLCEFADTRKCLNCTVLTNKNR
ncbi:carboxypeptidase B-like [Hyposmocoma kahamanoa]|uniref:carboxypeptidase B-like n=1 Tax=Hyposmocoma kahamanoa TaxID=1477025 RepID=UPI000E6D674F|nr:carboxypeptidase B-like [Hyposmocoma kahamanoa]